MRLYRDVAPAMLLASVLALAILMSVLGCRDDTESLAGPESGPATEPALASTATQPLAFIQVSAGFDHTCGVTRDYKAYCWGANEFGQLGNGTRIINVGSTTPVAVVGGLSFRHVSVGYQHSCGVTTDGRAYCWGFNFWGQVGDGTKGEDNWRVRPTAVTGSRHFRLVRAGYSHTCGITSAAEAFCWGEDGSGQLGDGTTNSAGRATPVRVLGGLLWLQLSGGGEHTCGITQSNLVYCWGLNDHGQLGTGNVTRRLKPAAVSGGRQFRQVDAGGYHTCAVTTANLAYCWGFNLNGALGDGTTTERLTPGAVSGLRQFDHVNAGDLHTCGVTLDGRGFCWGLNQSGQGGNGTTGSYQMPVQLGIALNLRQVTAGLYHSCGVTTDNRAYCWGAGGLLGDGTLTRRLLPVPVAGPM
jgi:alpha-tubulin suppressor-like RCC1 family protein